MPTFPEDAIDNVIARLPGRLGLFVKDLSSGTCLKRNHRQRFPTASIFKVPVIVELGRQVEDGRLSLDRHYRLLEGISRHGTGSLANMPGQPELSLRQYCRLMIAESDNMATDLILEIIGLESVNPTMDRLGLSDTRVNMTMGRWHYSTVGLDHHPINRTNDALRQARFKAGQKDFNALPFTDSLANNVTTAQDMASLLEQIYFGQLISPSASAAMLEMLKACTNRRMIPRYLDPAIAIAHKIGQSQRIRGDAAIVFLPHCPLIISALSLAPEPDQQRPGVQAIAEIARLLVQAIYPPAVRQPAD